MANRYVINNIINAKDHPFLILFVSTVSFEIKNVTPSKAK